MTSVSLRKNLNKMMTTLSNLCWTASKNGPVFNSRKYIRELEISFYGAIFTKKWHETRSSKRSSHPRPPYAQKPNQTTVSFGCINYFQLFIPRLSDKSGFLQEQISSWVLNPSTDVAFQQLKAWICDYLLETILAYLNTVKPVVIQTNASEHNLGVALL